MFTVYVHPYSQHSRRVLALLEIAGADYRTEHVNFEAGDHLSKKFLALNPNHQVPVLVDGKLVLRESNAILRYLCKVLALEHWYPADAKPRASVDEWLDWTQCRMSPAVIDIVLNQVFLGEAGDKTAIERGKAAMAEIGEILGDRLWESRYIAGSQPSIADLAVASNITQLGLADAIPEYKSIGDWYGRICEIEGFRKTLPPPMANAA